MDKRGVRDSGRKPCADAKRVHRVVERGTVGEAERDIRHAEDSVDAEFLRKTPHRLNCNDRRLRVGAHGECQRVKGEILFLETILRAFFEYSPRDGDTSVARVGNSRLVEAQSHERTAVFPNKRKDSVHRLALAVNRVDERLAIDALERPLERNGIGRIDLDRTRHDALHSLNSPLERRRLVYAGNTAVHVEDLCARVYLLHGFPKDIRRVAAQIRLLEKFLSRRVYALADDQPAVGLKLDYGRSRRDDGARLRR